jgi:hypothetical protein
MNCREFLGCISAFPAQLRGYSSGFTGNGGRRAALFGR